jgi:hypothetical protein
VKFKEMKIAIFYHLFQKNNWRNIFDEQMNKVCSSGLYAACDFIHLGINGNDDLPYNLPKFKINRNTILINESETLRSLWDFCDKNEDYYVLYFYAKGVTHYGTHREYNTNSWRLYLDYFNLHRWKDCVEKLKEYDTVGTEFIKESNYWDSEKKWRAENNWHFSGNFWWANSNYVKKLNPDYLFSDEDKNLYYRSEFWIGTLKPNYYSFHNTNSFCRYGHVYNPMEYMTI